MLLWRGRAGAPVTVPKLYLRRSECLRRRVPSLPIRYICFSASRCSLVLRVLMPVMNVGRMGVLMLLRFVLVRMGVVTVN